MLQHYRRGFTNVTPAAPTTGTPGACALHRRPWSTCARPVHQTNVPRVQALYNLCKVTKEQQTEASAADISPVLSRLVSRRPASLALAGSASLNSDAGSGSVGLVTPADAQTAVETRAVCIRLLCLLAHSSAHTRDQLWTCQGLDIFMDLLCEQVWRAVLCGVFHWFRRVRCWCVGTAQAVLS